MNDQKAALEAAHALQNHGTASFANAMVLDWAMIMAIALGEVEQATRYANQLAMSLAGKFPAVDVWKPLDDLIGLLTQIDNMTCGFIMQRDSARERISSLEGEVERMTVENAELLTRVGQIIRKVHILERHNQFFERCESGWCHPGRKEDPALWNAKDLCELNRQKTERISSLEAARAECPWCSADEKPTLARYKALEAALSVAREAWDVSSCTCDDFSCTGKCVRAILTRALAALEGK